mmetsp:Transcript_8133/g.10586  ORF Transcript_8133/g.10586 Transcript_8133/m.10586 type:complete len:298 (+) Transcript_8133:111-1004(+)
MGNFIFQKYADLMVARDPSPVLGSPSDFDLSYEDVEFESVDWAKLSGWLINPGQSKVIIQTHFGVQCSRSGWTPKGRWFAPLWDEESKFLPHCKHLAQEGYTILAYDMRNHGKSGPGPRPLVTWGKEERNDVIAAVTYITSRREYCEAPIGLLSICMGASATTFAYGDKENSLKNFPQLKAMVAIQPLNYTVFARSLGWPGWIIRGGNKVLKERGINLEDDFLPYIPDIEAPTRVIQNTNDPWTDLDLVNRFYQELQVEKDMVWWDLKNRRAAAYAYLAILLKPYLLGSTSISKSPE